jgi:UDP-glucose 4-epimerase
LQAAIDLNIKNFIFSSTCAVYGNIRVPASEEMPKKPASVYAQTKSVFEDVLMSAEKEGKINAAILRYFNAAGRNQVADLYEEHDPETHLIPNLMKLDDPVIYGHGNDVRDYIHVIDICQAHIAAYQYLIDNQKGLICNIGTGQGYSANELVKIVSEITGRKMKPVYAPARAGDAAFLVSNTNKMLRDLKFLPKYDIVDMIKSM